MYILQEVSFCFFFITLSVKSDSGVENVRVQRSDLDILQTCIDNFNVHKDKIIRTQDSQNMGAKYLNEIDLGSRQECLRLCCETDNCDVFVFEEKNSGSCYLFHCGPPEDFKCKFTHHVNYSSGVLSINRHLPDLVSQIKLTKHEQDLTKLRKPESEPSLLRPPVLPEVKKSLTSTTTTIASRETVPEVNKIAAEGRKCSRFQFECRSTGECIAIYNACDGIPQCADGSDEAIELGCPGSATAAPATQAASQSVPVRHDDTLQRPQANQLSGMYLQPPPLPREPPQLQPLIPHQDADFLRPVNDPRNLNSRISYDSQNYAPQMHMQGQANWVGVPHPPNQMVPQVPQYADKNSHIFNHKESGFQVPDGQEMSQMQYAETIGARNYPKMGNYYEDVNYRQPVQQENWPLDEGAYENQPKYIPQENIQVSDPSRNKPTDYSSKTLTAKVETVNPTHVQEKLAHDLKHSKENMEHGTVSSPHKKIKIDQHVHHEQYPDVVSYRIVDNDLQDGIAQTPRGAVLSVTLGLIITLIMSIMIGCRLKMVRRRLRRGGKPYAHDADFLVNGMYL